MCFSSDTNLSWSCFLSVHTKCLDGATAGYPFAYHRTWVQSSRLPLWQDFISPPYFIKKQRCKEICGLTGNHKGHHNRCNCCHILSPSHSQGTMLHIWIPPNGNPPRRQGLQATFTTLCSAPSTVPRPTVALSGSLLSQQTHDLTWHARQPSFWKW